MSYLTYRPDLAQPPDWLIAQAHEEWMANQDLLAVSRTPQELRDLRRSQLQGIKFHYEDPTRDQETSADFSVVTAGAEIQAWAQTHIDPNSRTAIVCITGGHYVAPHRDFDRTRGINYWVTLGGDQVKTCWYRPLDQPIRSATRRDLLKFFARPWSYGQLELVESHSIAQGRWHELDVTEIHSVEGLEPTEARWGLSVSLGLPR
jgi:hypothetical protein